MGTTGWASEHLAHYHRRHGAEQDDAQGGEGVLTLGHRVAGDHAAAEAGHGQFGGEVVVLFHGEPWCCRHCAGGLPRSLGGTGGSLPGVRLG